jgi:uncharacterized protein YmfQ (DUF2313 family)
MTLPPPRTTDQAQAGIATLLPDGWAATRDPDDYEGALFRPMGQEFSLIEGSLAAMLPQIDPRQAPNLLPNWEQALGLPDPCMAAYPITDTVTRGLLAFERLTNAGTICAGYFERQALLVGETITIQEFPASLCGTMKCGDSLNPSPGQCNILVTLPTTEVTRFVCGASTAGDSLGAYDHSVMECIIRAGVPLYVTPYFSYTG